VGHKPSSVNRGKLAAGGHLSWPTVARRLPGVGAAYPSLKRAGRTLGSYLALQGVGFTLPATSPPPRCALTAPFHPYRQALAVLSAVYFLWHFPEDYSRWQLAITLPGPARTFLRLESEPATTSPTPNLIYLYYIKVHYTRIYLW